MTDVANLTASLAAAGAEIDNTVAQLRELIGETLVVNPEDDVMIQQVQDKAQYIIDKITATTQGLGAPATTDDDDAPKDKRILAPDRQVADPSPNDPSTGVGDDPGVDPLKGPGTKDESRLARKDEGKDKGKTP